MTRPIILMYHSVSENSPSDPYCITPRDFEDQITWLEEHAYKLLSLEALVGEMKNARISQSRIIAALTFDDGYQDFIANALPILKRHGIPSTMFLIPGLLGQVAGWNQYNSNSRLMNLSEVHAIKANGVSLGSHTMTHIDLTTVNRGELMYQLSASLSILQEWSETFYAFSYPWGRYTSREVNAVRAAGYDCAVTADFAIKIEKKNCYRLGRLSIVQDMSMDAFQRAITQPVPRKSILTQARNWIGQMRMKWKPETGHNE